MRSTGHILAVAGFCSLMPVCVAANLSAVRTYSLPDLTRIVVELDGEVTFRSERIDNPERIFFDLKDVALRLEGAESRRYHSVAVGDKRIQKVRIAETQPGVSRIVFDMAAPGVSYSVEELANPQRLVIEFRAGVATAAKPVHEVPSLSVESIRSGARQAAATGRIPDPPATPLERAEPIKTVPLPTPAPAETAVPARGPSRSLTRALGLKISRIVLDPGHGGHDHGTISPRGMSEKEVVLDVALRLGALIEERTSAEVVYTRSDDTFVPLERRTQIANENKADLFLSIHANSSPFRGATGIETYYLNFATSAAALEVAARENASSHHSVFELREMLQKIALKEKADESKEFAAKVHQSMQKAARAALASKDRSLKRAPFVVLIGAQMPSVLTEIGFVSNAKEEAMLKKPEYRQKIAEALLQGIANYANTLSHFQLARKGTGERAPVTR